MSEESILRLVNEEWEELEPLIVLQESRVPLEMVPEMAETLCEFFRAHDLLERFIQWSILKEIEHTKDYTCLFREDSFVIMIINRLAFSDVGIQYLQSILQSLLKSLLTVERSLDINKMRVGEADYQKNVQLLIKVIDDFLPIFAKSSRQCPLALRRTFTFLQKTVDAKFGKQDTAPFVIEFMFFHYICPAIVNPKKYDMLPPDTDVPPHALLGLVNVSKLLNDLALNSHEKWQDKEVGEFIKKRHPMLLQHLYVLTDEKEIMNMIKAQPPVVTSSEEKERVSNRWKQFMASLANYSRKGSMTCMSEELHKLLPEDVRTAKLKAFNERLNAMWCLEKETKSVTSYFIKDKDRPSLIMVKANCSVEVPIKQCKAMLLKYQWDTKIDTLVSSYEELFVSQGYTENYCMFKLPFPMNTRDFTFGQWDYSLENDTKFVLLHDNLSSKVSRKKHFIRGQMLLSGYQLTVDRSNANKTNMVALFQIDPKGSLPQWLVNLLSSTRTHKLSMLKEKIERKYRKETRKSAKIKNETRKILESMEKMTVS